MGGGVSQNIAIADKRRGGIRQIMTMADEGGGGVLKRPNLADIMCEQPLNETENTRLKEGL